MWANGPPGHHCAEEEEGETASTALTPPTSARSATVSGSETSPQPRPRSPQTTTSTAKPVLQPKTQEFIERCRNFPSSYAHGVHERIHALFYRFSNFCAQQPYVVISTALLWMSLCSLGLLNLEKENDLEALYVPKDAVARRDRDWVRDNFGDDPTPLEIYVTAANNGDNVLDKLILNGLFSLDTIVKGTTAAYSGEQLTYDNRCWKPDSSNCSLVSVLDYWNYDRQAMQNDPNIYKTINAPAFTSSGAAVSEEQVMGGIRRNAQGRITHVSGFQYVLDCRVEKERMEGALDVDPRSDTWTLQATEEIRQYSSSYLRQYPYSHASHKVESQADFFPDDFLLVFFGLVVSHLYTCLVLGSRSWIKSRTLLAVVSLVSIAMGAVSSYGLGSLFGVKTTQTVNLVPFLLWILGTIDMFVVTDVLRKKAAPTDLSPMDPKRFARAVALNRVTRAVTRAGASAFVTTIAGISAFVFGSFSPLHQVRSFSAFAALGIFFIFFYLITFFGSFMVLDVRRSTQGSLDWLCWCTRNKKEPAPCCGCSQIPLCVPEPPYSEDQGRILQIFMGKYMAAGFSTIPWKILIVLMEVILTAFGIWGAVLLQQEYNTDWLVPEDSYLQQTFDVRDQYFAGGSLLAAVYTREADYSLPTVQVEMWGIGEALRTNAYVRNETVQSWHDCFVAFCICNKSLSGTCPEQGTCNVSSHSIVPSDRYFPWLQEFLQTSTGDAFAPAIRFTATTNTSIAATKVSFGIIGDTIKSSAIAVDAMKSLRATVASYSTVSPLVYSKFFLVWEGYDVMKREAIISLIFSGCSVFAACLVFMGNANTACLVLLIVTLMDINLLGYMHWIGLTCNDVTLVCLTIAVSVAVHYCVHMCHAYLVHRGTRQQRMVQCLADLGASMLNGAITMLLAVLWLWMSNTYVYRVFFKMALLMIGLSLFHAVLLLPVLLCMVGTTRTPCPISLAGDVEKSEPFVYEPDPDMEFVIR